MQTINRAGLSPVARHSTDSEPLWFAVIVIDPGRRTRRAALAVRVFSPAGLVSSVKLEADGTAIVDVSGLGG